MTWRELLKTLQHFDKEAPSLLDKEAYATFGNDENGNAELLPIENVVPAGNLDVNGCAGVLDVADLVLALEELD